MTVTRRPGAQPGSPHRQRSSVALISLVTILLTAVGWAHGQLVNPGFEEGDGSLQGWQVFGNYAGNVTVSSISPRSGSWAASVSGPPTSAGDTSYSGLTQGVATNPTTTTPAWRETISS